MSLERQTLGAQTVVHGLSVAIRQKLTEMSATDGAFHLVADIERANQRAKKVTQLDKPLAGKYLGEKGYELLHFQIIAFDTAKIRKNPYLCKK